MTLLRHAPKRFLVHVSTAAVTFLLSFALGVLISPIRFSLDGMGRGKMLDSDDYFGVQSYTSTYFIKLSFSSVPYRSPEKANEVFTAAVKSAVRIIDRGPKYRQGSKVGERAVAILRDPERNEEFASVFWTYGRFLFSVDSSSLTHVLQFEQYRNADERE